jgi:serine/threonine protein kinase
MKKIGPYSLEAEIGKGGNGQVFRARTTSELAVAIKVLRVDRRPGVEPLKRFESEIAVLTQLCGTPGVMPILDSGKERGRPWFTMPIATPLREALHDASLSDIVEAFSVFAQTLDRLEEKGIYHRDVKPENLFCLPSKEWVIGDFGIHKGPENPVLTKDGRRIGPALYCAQEMLDYHQDQDHSRADVFSLAKTLWVIATGQRLPLQGQHPEGFRGAWLENYRTEANTAPLDKLLIRATALIPEERITMRQFGEELVAWLSPPQDVSGPGDLSDVGSLLVDPYRLANSELAEWSEKLKKMSGVVQLAANDLGIVEKSLRTLGSGAIVNGASISNSREMFSALGHDIVLKHPNEYSSTYVSLLGPGGTPPYLHSGFVVALGEGSKVILRAGHVLCTGKFYPNKMVALFQKTETVDADSILVSGIVNKMCEALLPSLKDAVIKFSEEMRASATSF